MKNEDDSDLVSEHIFNLSQKLDLQNIKMKNTDLVHSKLYLNDLLGSFPTLSFDLNDPNFPRNLMFFTNSIRGSPSGIAKEFITPDVFENLLSLFLTCSYNYNSMDILENVVILLAVFSHDFSILVSESSEQIVQRVLTFLDDLEPSYGDFCQNLLIFSGNLCFDIESINTFFLQNNILLKTSNLSILQLNTKESNELYDTLYWFIRTLTIHEFDPKYIQSFEMYIKIVLQSEGFDKKAIENILILLITLQSHGYYIPFTKNESIYLQKLHLYQDRKILSLLLQYLAMDGVEETCAFVVDCLFVENISALILKHNAPLGVPFFRILNILATKYSLYPDEAELINYISPESIEDSLSENEEENNGKNHLSQNSVPSENSEKVEKIFKEIDERPRAILIYPAIIKCLINHTFKEKIEAAKYLCTLFNQESFDVRKVFLNAGILTLILDQLDDTDNYLFLYYSEILYRIGEAAEYFNYDLTSEKEYDEIVEKYAQFSLEENLDENIQKLIFQVQRYFPPL